MASKPGVYRTTISLSQKSKEVCDAFVETHGLRENISDFSDLVARALMAYCLPPAEPLQAVAEEQAPYHAAPPPPPATLAAALAAKARAAAAEREMLHAHPTAAPVAGNRSLPRKGVPVHSAG